MDLLLDNRGGCAGSLEKDEDNLALILHCPGEVGERRIPHLTVFVELQPTIFDEVLVPAGVEILEDSSGKYFPPHPLRAGTGLVPIHGQFDFVHGSKYITDEP